MTSGERMVWAAEFVRMMGPWQTHADRAVDEAAKRATDLVAAMRRAAKLKSGHEDMVAALEDMTGAKR